MKRRAFIGTYGPMLERRPEVANELVALKCDVILAAGPYVIRAATRQCAWSRDSAAAPAAGG